MRIIRHRSTAWVAGLAYLLASALSGLLHQHAQGGHSHDSHSHVASCTDDHSEGLAAAEQHRGIAGHEGDPSSPEPFSDDCLACRFVAQGAVVSVPSSDLAPRPIVAEVRVSAPRFFIEPVYSSSLARAPPLG
jgi:hypothetical protein